MMLDRGLIQFDRRKQDRPTKQPCHPDQVYDDPQRAVPEVVMRLPTSSWSVSNRDLDHPAPLSEQQRPEEAMDPVERWQAQGHFPREDPDRATRVFDGLTKNQVAHSIGNLAHQSL